MQSYCHEIEVKLIDLNNYINAADVPLLISLLDNNPFTNLRISQGHLGIKT